MDGVFTKVEEADGLEEISEPSMGTLSKSKVETDTMQQSTSIPTPSLSLEKDNSVHDECDEKDDKSE